MNADSEITERWVERTMATYPAEMLSFMNNEKDQFRNPVGHTLQENLTRLVRELLGAMDKQAIAIALDALIRMRAVQSFSPSEAVRFVFELRTAASETFGTVPESLQSRIDELALMAFDIYMACREQIFELRARELKLRARFVEHANGGTQ